MKTEPDAVKLHRAADWQLEARRLRFNPFDTRTRSACWTWPACGTLDVSERYFESPQLDYDLLGEARRTLDEATP